jgi:hypothetical protein
MGRAAFSGLKKVLLFLQAIPCLGGDSPILISLSEQLRK